MIRFACRCGKPLKAPERFAGRSARCPVCGGSVVVPQEGAAPTLAASTPQPQTASLQPSCQITFQEWPSDCEAPSQDTSNEYALAAAPPAAWVPSVIPAVDANYVPPPRFERHPVEAWLDPLAGMKFVIQISGIP